MCLGALPLSPGNLGPSLQVYKLYTCLICPVFTSSFPAGNSQCFLFSLHPTMAVYTATGYNTHYMYLQQTAQTMPNGLVEHTCTHHTAFLILFLILHAGYGWAAGVLWTVAEWRV